MSKKLKEELLALTKVELLERIKSLGLSGYSRFKKEELADLIIAHSKRSKLPRSAAGTPKKEPAAGKARTSKSRAAKPLSNGIAVQHPSASPSARRYGSRGAPEPAAEALPEPAEEAKAEVSPPAVWPDRGAIPERYGVDVLVALPRDPGHLFCFWEISGDTLGSLAEEMGEAKWNTRKLVLKLLPIGPGGSTGVASHTLDVYGEIGRWHVAVPGGSQGKSFILEIGFNFADGSYRKVLSSEPAAVPRGTPVKGGEARFMLVRPARARSRVRIESLETRIVRRFDSAEALRIEVERAVAQRRKELGIGAAPDGASEQHSAPRGGPGNE